MLIPGNSKGYHQNVYYVKNTQKYIGLSNKIFYLSSWEYRFFLKLEENPHVIRWSANTFTIDYHFEGRLHKYYLDVYAEINNNGRKETYLIEIKPDAQVHEPIPPKKKSPKAMDGFLRRSKEFMKNRAKWFSAGAFCSSRGFVFLIITEKAYYTVEGVNIIKLRDSANF